MRSLWLVMLVLPVVSGPARGAAPSPEPLPAVGDIRNALRARNGMASRYAVLFSKLNFHVLRDEPTPEPLLVPMQASSYHYRREEGHYWLQSHVFSLRPEEGTDLRGETLRFIRQDFERRYESSISHSEIPGTGAASVLSTIDKPQPHDGWIPFVLGLRTNADSIWLSDEAVVEGWEDVAGQHCVRVTDGEWTWWFAPSLGYAPVRRTREYAATEQIRHARQNEQTWFGFEPAPGAELLMLPRRHVDVFTESNDERYEEWPERFTIDILILSVESIQVADAMVEQSWPASVPVLVGAFFKNNVTGLPEGLTSFGYSIEQLRHAMWRDETPFGLDLPEIRFLRQYQAQREAAQQAAQP